MQVIYDKNRQRVPVKAWVDDLEPIRDNGLGQAINASALSFLHKHVALMPDTHYGYGVPIGCVFCTDRYVVPNAVGVDIGCGMRFTRANIEADRLLQETNGNGKLGQALCGGIRRSIPIGFNKYKIKQYSSELKSAYRNLITKWNYDEDYPSLVEEFEDSFYSLGTLGGGNHFIELQRNVNSGDLCVMIHSGSRHFGHQIATKFNNVAIKMNERWFSSGARDLAFLPLDSRYGSAYKAWMDLALRFAKINRRYIMAKVVYILESQIDGILFTPDLDVHHNYASMENHFGKNVMVHRKGAIRVREGEYGIIPGAMGSKSFIVEGKGCEEAFHSASHGAGRCMSRTQAKEDFSVEEMVVDLKENGVILSTPNVPGVLDEYRKAYKNVENVIEQEKDMVEITDTLETVCVIKA